MQQQEYLATQILGASRLEVVRLLYRGALTSVQEARQHLSAGEIMLRSKSVSRAIDFLSELTVSLNHDAGGSLSKNLAELYGYMQHLLLQAHAEQSDAKLAEAARLLTTLLEGWDQISEAPAAGTAPVATPVSVVEEPPAPPVAASNPYDSGVPMMAQSRSWNL
jgi:flagellar protein FliS